MFQDQYPGVDARLVSIVKIKCRRLVGRYGIREEDLPDFRQEWISAALRSPEYQDRENPRFMTFIGRNIDRMIIQEIRRRTAAKRDFKAEAYSLDDYIKEGESEDTWHDAISEEHYLEMTGATFRDHRQSVSLRHDADAFLETLPSDLKALAQHLKRLPMEQIPAAAGISRATAFRRLQKLREAASQFFSEE